MKTPDLLQKMNATQQRIQTFFTAALAVLTALTLLLVVSCNKKPAAKPTQIEKIENKIDDALDRRPGEPVLDAIEDASKDAGKVKTAVQEAVKEAAK
jgi:hypothetical protein